MKESSFPYNCSADQQSPNDGHGAPAAATFFDNLSNSHLDAQDLILVLSTHTSFIQPRIRKRVPSPGTQHMPAGWNIGLPHLLCQGERQRDNVIPAKLNCIDTDTDVARHVSSTSTALNV